MDALWHRTWPEMAELHVFDPEGDMLLILERYQEDDLAPSDAAPPLSADVSDWPEPEPESVRCESRAETAKAEVDGLRKPETSLSTCLPRRSRNQGLKRFKCESHQSILSSHRRLFELV
ncbi:hypothetical protein BKA65DRAFT_531942 [Rhexocercosporidium sp. MPI-PUGE-AT-0058]|nr:hypothetical protein BKA65DRAFT_531942 [Rhexocercosporidium sp. MPI-PUGE-AT-0058]